MGKIGDLFVRLGLKSDDYKKGIESAKSETKGFGKSLSSMKAGALAVWAAIGTAVVQFGKDFIGATNKMGDAWAQQMAGMKAGYHTLLASLSNIKVDTSNGIGGFFKSLWSNAKDISADMKEASKAAVEMEKAFDAEFELTNSIRLQKGAIQQELNELYIMMRDTSLSPQQRKAAAEKYKALLQPIADAEVNVYQNMLSAAIKAWQAGNDLDREYSVEEMTEFFSKIGTEYEKMQEKFPDLMRVYENRKGDVQNQIIFDTIGKLQQAVNQMSDIDRLLSRVTLSINKAGKGDGFGTGRIDALGGITAGAVQLTPPKLMTEQWLAEQMEIGNAYGEWYKQMVQEVDALNGMLESSMISAFSGGLQAFTDMLFGIEGADGTQILAAVMQPIAQMATQLGEMLISTGLGIEAFKNSLKSLNGAVAIAAGVALIALGAAMSSGIKAMGHGAGGSTATTGSGGASGTSGMSRVETYQQEITVNVVGRIAGSDILLSGSKTQNKWNR